MLLLMYNQLGADIFQTIMNTLGEEITLNFSATT